MTVALLEQLIDGARQLAGEEGRLHKGRIWHFEGGRRCPIDWDGCSQAVYVDLASGEYDYGQPGGPGHADCRENCHHGMQPPGDDE